MYDFINLVSLNTMYLNLNVLTMIVSALTMTGAVLHLMDWVSEHINWYSKWDTDDVESSPEWADVWDMEVNTFEAELHIVSDVKGTWAEELYRSIQQAKQLPKQKFQPLGYSNTYLVRC